MLQENNNKVVSADLDALKLLMLDTIYPVGSIYMSVNNVSPSNLFGGSWEQIEDTFLLAAGSTYTAGDTGGSATHTPGGTLSGGAVGNHTLTTAETPAHTHTRGTMEITGTLKVDPDQGWCRVTGDGAFTFDSTAKRATGGAAGTTDVNSRAIFTASRTWTGATSSVGGDGAHNHPFTQPTFTGTSQDTMPPYLTVYIWKRVS